MVTGSEKESGSIRHDKVTAFLTEPGAARTDIHASLHPLIDNLAPLKVDLLLEGETGTGKDTLTRRIYQLSGAKGPLISVNCAAIPENLAESELFGVIAAPIPAPRIPGRATLKPLTKAFCFWMK